MAMEAPATFADDWSEPVTKKHDTGQVASRAVAADWLQWMRLPAISGIECVQILRREGFIVDARPSGCISLRRDGDRIDVPLAGRLDPDVLVAILVRAAIAPSRFHELFDQWPRFALP